MSRPERPSSMIGSDYGDPIYGRLWPHQEVAISSRSSYAGHPDPWPCRKWLAAVGITPSVRNIMKMEEENAENLQAGPFQATAMFARFPRIGSHPLRQN